MKIVIRPLIAGFCLGTVFGLAFVGCLPMQQQVKTVRDSVKLAEQACVILRDVAPDSKQAMEICAKEEELRPYIKLILGGRARAAAHLDGSAPDTSDSK